MRPVQRASWQEYVNHMIRREKFKVSLHRRAPFDEPVTMKERCAFIGEKWDDLYRQPDVFWLLVELDRDDFDRLIPAYQCFGHQRLAGKDNLWIRLRHGRNRSLLTNMAKRARKTGYLDLDDDRVKPHRQYYGLLKTGELTLRDDNRLVIGSNPRGSSDPTAYEDGDWHLADGWGRSLPYEILLLEEPNRPFQAEAYLQINKSDPLNRDLYETWKSVYDSLPANR